MAGADRVQHDQEHVRAAGRRQRPSGLAPLLEPVPAPERRRQDRDEADEDGKLSRTSRRKPGGMPLQRRDQPRRDAQRQEEPGGPVDPGERRPEGREQASERSRSRAASQRPRRPPHRTRIASRTPSDEEDAPDWSAGSARRNDGSSSRDDSGRTSACAGRSTPTSSSPETSPHQADRSRNENGPGRFAAGSGDDAPAGSASSNTAVPLDIGIGPSRIGDRTAGECILARRVARVKASSERFGLPIAPSRGHTG